MRVEQARALRELAVLTPENASIWVWWDFGYATQYFANRHTIADGARHGGANLYLPAAVYSSDNPHFAAQLIKYTGIVEPRSSGVSAADLPRVFEKGFTGFHPNVMPGKLNGCQGRGTDCR